MVGVGAVIRGLPRTATYEEAMRIIAGLGGSAERLAQLQELRDARADIDAALKAAEDAIATAGRSKAEADSAAQIARDERDRSLSAQNASIQAATDLQRKRDELGTETRALESREAAHRLAVTAATAALADRDKGLTLAEQAMADRNAGSLRLNEEAAADRSAAAEARAEADRRLARIQEAAAGA